LPEPERLSILSATILLAYALARFINIPVREFSVQFPGLYLSVDFNLQFLVTVIVAGLTAAGADWLLRDHPVFVESQKRNTQEHWILPGLTALVIGLPLLQVSPGPIWWIGFVLSGSILMLVLVAEYIVVNPDDVRQPLASAGLTAVSFALFLVLAVSLEFSEVRLVILLPALMAASWLVSLRTLHLRLHGRWAFVESGVVAVIIGQFATGFHYLPVSPVRFGLLLLGPAYALTSLLSSLAVKTPLRRAVVEPLILLGLIWGSALWIQ